MSGVSAVTTTTTTTTTTTMSVAPRRRCRDVHTQRTNLHHHLHHHHHRSSLPTKPTTTTTTRAIFTQYSYEHSHDEKYQSWLHDLVTVVESNTWSAVPALLRFPSAEPEIVLALAAGAGQAGTPLGPSTTHPTPPHHAHDLQTHHLEALIISSASFIVTTSVLITCFIHRHHPQSSREARLVIAQYVERFHSGYDRRYDPGSGRSWWTPSCARVRTRWIPRRGAVVQVVLVLPDGGFKRRLISVLF